MSDPKDDLYGAFLLLKTKEEVDKFLKDLCTPQEVSLFAERWWVCRLLDAGNLSYREIHSITGASLTTIVRVARFLKIEPHKGYVTVLGRLNKEG